VPMPIVAISSGLGTVPIDDRAAATLPDDASSAASEWEDEARRDDERRMCPLCLDVSSTVDKVLGGGDGGREMCMRRLGRVGDGDSGLCRSIECSPQGPAGRYL